jgi:hypothetical protein
MLDRAKNFILIADVIDLLSFDQLNFFHDLNARIVSILFVLDEFDSSEGAYEYKK